MEIDHIFIFTDSNGAVADELVAFGLTEGSNRVHPGQGTANRKFYFENFFLEIVWVHDESEIKSDLIRPIGLWERANYATNGFAPFGICLVNTDETDALFNESIQYQPVYFPAGQTFDIRTNNQHPDLPWICRLPFKEPSQRKVEPMAHVNGLKRLTKATFTYVSEQDQAFTDFFQEQPSIEFVKSSEVKLILTFDNHLQGSVRSLVA